MRCRLHPISPWLHAAGAGWLTFVYPLCFDPPTIGCILCNCRLCNGLDLRDYLSLVCLHSAFALVRVPCVPLCAVVVLLRLVCPLPLVRMWVAGGASVAGGPLGSDVVDAKKGNGGPSTSICVHICSAFLPVPVDAGMDNVTCIDCRIYTNVVVCWGDWVRSVLRASGAAAGSGVVGRHVAAPCLRRCWKWLWELFRCASSVGRRLHCSLSVVCRDVVVSGEANLALQLGGLFGRAPAVAFPVPRDVVLIVWVSVLCVVCAVVCSCLVLGFVLPLCVLPPSNCVCASPFGFVLVLFPHKLHHFGELGRKALLQWRSIDMKQGYALSGGPSPWSRAHNGLEVPVGPDPPLAPMGP